MAVVQANEEEEDKVFDTPHFQVIVGKRVRKRLDAKSIVQLIQSFDVPSGTRVLFQNLTPTANLAAIGATCVGLPPTSNPFGINAGGIHFQSGPSEFRASIVSPDGFAITEVSDIRIGDSESVGDGLAICELEISLEIVKAFGSKGIEKLFPIKKVVMEPAMQGQDMIGRARTRT